MAPRRGAGQQRPASSGGYRISSGAACRAGRSLQATLSAPEPVRGLERYMKKSVSMESASALIDARIKQLGDWRGKMLARVRQIVHEADPEIIEEWKWMGN